MKKIICILCLFLFLSSCAKVLYYGYLPGSNFKYYQPIEKVDLEGKRINLIVNDSRFSKNSIKCSEIELDGDTELEGAKGFEYFKNYCKAMIEFNNGKCDSTSQDTLFVNLNGLSAKYKGFGYVNVYGLIEFEAHGLGILNETYCSEMVDGDDDAPLQSYSIATRKTALRKMVSGSTRRALEKLIKDIKHKMNRPLNSSAN
ncbi:MAG: hypothetical protein CVV22_12445 [Ignavibacteriae bacterium HGW-Ignavibacteriae-1]|jgi:hypothetical protein|nr:MAG: hypothetical protein CVV22_12445 [Ignavibacteriae bacterium HGW-Ignavibacteriae-1]